MFQIITIVISIISIVIAFFSPRWGWIVLTLPILISIITLWSFKQRLKGRSYIPEISPVANAVLDKFGYYYSFPFACRDFSASAATLRLSGVGVAIISLFHGFWWGVAAGLGNYFIMGYVAHMFNPTLIENLHISKETHDEIVSFIRRKKEEVVSFFQHKQEKMDNSKIKKL